MWISPIYLSEFLHPGLMKSFPLWECSGVHENAYCRTDILRKEVTDKLAHYTVEISTIMGRVTNHKGETMATFPNCKAIFR